MHVIGDEVDARQDQATPTKTTKEELVEKQKISPHTSCRAKRMTTTAKLAARYSKSPIGLITMGKFVLIFPLSSPEEAAQSATLPE